MPCRYDEGPSLRTPETRHGMTIADFEAALCGVFIVLEATGRNLGGGSNLLTTLNSVDWIEADISRRSVEKWWTAHKKEDEKRRKQEQAERDKKALKASALAKLTNDEKKVLGL